MHKIKPLVAAALLFATALAASPTSAAPRKPDLIVSPRTMTDASVYTYEFHDDPAYSGDYCDIQEGLISSPGVHKLLAFTAGSTNIGDADLNIGRPESHPEWFQFQPCHGHYHFDGYAVYRLLDLNGVQVASSTKMGFCIVDSWPPDNWDPFNPKTRQRFIDCDRQGLSVGWSDDYAATVHGQWIEIDNVAPGNYVVEVTVNPDHLLPEKDYTNNTATFPVTIP